MYNQAPIAHLAQQHHCGMHCQETSVHPVHRTGFRKRLQSLFTCTHASQQTSST